VPTRVTLEVIIQVRQRANAIGLGLLLSIMIGDRSVRTLSHFTTTNRTRDVELDRIDEAEPGVVSYAI